MFNSCWCCIHACARSCGQTLDRLAVGSCDLLDVLWELAGCGMVGSLLLLLSTEAFCGALIVLTVGGESFLVDAAGLHGVGLLRDLLCYSNCFVQLDLRFEFSH